MLALHIVLHCPLLWIFWYCWLLVVITTISNNKINSYFNFLQLKKYAGLSFDRVFQIFCIENNYISYSFMHC